MSTRLPEPSDRTFWYRCPWSTEFCGLDATLEGVTFFADGSWLGELTCPNGHSFQLGSNVKETSE